MSAATDYLEEQWMRYAFTATAMGTRPTTWFVGLHSADPGETGATSEISGSAYARTAVTWTASTNQVSNAGTVTFPTVITTGYTVTHITIWDAASAGNCLYKGALAVSKALLVGEALSFAIGELALSID